MNSTEDINIQFYDVHFREQYVMHGDDAFSTQRGATGASYIYLGNKSEALPKKLLAIFCFQRKKRKLTVIQLRVGDESSAGWTFQASVGGGSSVADALQVVMPEGRTPGRHDGRDAEVRRFSPLPLRRHPSSRARRHLLVRVSRSVSR